MFLVQITKILLNSNIVYDIIKKYNEIGDNMKADFKISSKDIINEYKSASSKSTVGKILGISYSKVVKTLLSAGIDI